MVSYRNAVLVGLTLAVAAACGRTFVIVPSRDPGYTARDTLYGRRDGENVRVVFRHDTTWRVDTVIRRDTLWRAGSRVDTVLYTRSDTVRVAAPRDSLRRQFVRVDTVRLTRVDTVRVGRIVRVDTLRIARVDTVRVARVDTVRVGGTGRVDTVRVVRVDTLRVPRVDTLRIVRVDTVRVGRVDTVRIGRVDTVRVVGRRTLFVPPGQYPPAGQCRVWIHDRPPGQQARPAACNALGNIPEGAFVLFNGEAWDIDYDWVAESRSGSVPPEIVALTRRRGR